jgi:hypothetical protein
VLSYKDPLGDGGTKGTRANSRTVTRYFLHLCRQDDMIADPDGGELSSLDEAKLAAIEGLRELLASAVRGGTSFDTTGIRIENEAGQELAFVSIKDALPTSLLEIFIDLGQR